MRWSLISIAIDFPVFLNFYFSTLQSIRHGVPFDEALRARTALGFFCYRGEGFAAILP
jgi:hypothetical protein